MQGGLELEFAAGKGVTTIILLTLVPMCAEAIAAALMCKALFGLPWALCFACGFALGAVSLAVLIPSILGLIEKKLGIKKGVPLLMLASSSFDDILSITIFSVFASIGFVSVNTGSD